MKCSFFSYFWLKEWILNKEYYIYLIINVGLPNSHGAGGTWGFFEYRWTFFTRILSFPGKWLKSSWNTSIALKWHWGGEVHISQPSARLDEEQGWPQPWLDQGRSLREDGQEFSHPRCFQPSPASLCEAPHFGHAFSLGHGARFQIGSNTLFPRWCHNSKAFLVGCYSSFCFFNVINCPQWQF